MYRDRGLCMYRGWGHVRVVYIRTYRIGIRGTCTCCAWIEIGGTHLLRQLMEEEFGEVCNAWLSVFQAEGDGTDVSLHLHHVVEDEVAKDGQRVLPHQN